MMPKQSQPNQHPLTIYQWNCRTFRGKKATIEQYLHKDPPDIWALQETDTANPKLRGYETFTQPNRNRAAILVTKHLTAQAVDLDTQLDAVFIEIIPRRPNQPSLFILNVYSPPTHSLNGIDTLLHRATTRAGANPFILLGDFNAPHNAWSYPRPTKKGVLLQQSTQQHLFYLCNDPTSPTRIGNSVSRDTIPDLTFARNTSTIDWQVLKETLGSDHFIINIQVEFTVKKRKIGTAHITDWQAFRHDGTSLPSPTTDLDEWTKALQNLRGHHTKHIELTTETPAVDNHLDHLWTARRGLINRWRRQKHNRKLKQRIARITQQAMQYAQQLATQNWHTFCDQLGGTLSTKRAWHILRHLLGTTPPDRQKPQISTDSYTTTKVRPSSSSPQSRTNYSAQPH